MIEAKSIPRGLKKSEFELTLHNKAEKNIFEKHILKMLLRDFVVMYSIEDYDSYFKVYFYCYPNAELQLIYTLGCYNQSMFGYYKKSSITESSHALSKNYLEEYRLK